MSEHCHGCSCHLSAPCGACENCRHWDDEDCGDCQNCDHNEPDVPVQTEEDCRRYKELYEVLAIRRRISAPDGSYWGYAGKPYSNFKFGYASKRYTLRKMTSENKARVIQHLLNTQGYPEFGYRIDPGNVLVLYID